MSKQGLRSGEVEVVPYDPAWDEKYSKEAQMLWNAIGNRVADIQHIGSTAIKGMSAKPIIDIAVAVEVIDIAPSLTQSLKAIGYDNRGKWGGIEGHYFFRKGNPREYFLHVFEKQSDFWRRRLAFRDYLIAHKDVALAYQTLKMNLAALYPDDRGAYTCNKKAFVEEITDIALKAGFSHPANVALERDRGSEFKANE